MDIIGKIEKNDAENVKSVFTDIMKNYLSPSFGAISKRDFEILLFMKLQELKIFNENPEIYEMVSSLKITRTKARNLLYETKLRNSTEEQLDNELKKLLIAPIFLKENDKIALEIGNPFLIDHLKSKLKSLGHISDGSFSNELIKLTETAYISLFDMMLPDKEKKEILNALLKCGLKTDTSFKNFLKGVLKNLGKKFAGEIGDKYVEKIVDYLGPIIDVKINDISSIFKELNIETLKQKK